MVYGRLQIPRHSAASPLPVRGNAVRLRVMQDVLAGLFQHAAMTAGVTVRVAVNFMPDESRSEARR